MRRSGQTRALARRFRYGGKRRLPYQSDPDVPTPPVPAYPPPPLDPFYAALASGYQNPYLSAPPAPSRAPPPLDPFYAALAAGVQNPYLPTPPAPSHAPPPLPKAAKRDRAALSRSVKAWAGRQTGILEGFQGDCDTILPCDVYGQYHRALKEIPQYRLIAEALNRGMLVGTDPGNVCAKIIAALPSADWQRRHNRYISQIEDGVELLQSYTQDPGSLQEELRSGEETSPEVAELQSMILGAPVTEQDLIVWRGVQNRGTFERGVYNGIWVSQGFLSTSVYSWIAAEFAYREDNKFFMMIHLPRGSHALSVAGHSTRAREGEILLPHDSEFSILSIKRKPVWAGCKAPLKEMRTVVELVMRKAGGPIQEGAVATRRREDAPRKRKK